jgi:hypothetical protein
MMKSVLLYSVAATATAAAFVPQSQQRAGTALNEFCRGYVGGDSVEPMFIGETGSKNFDPLNISEVRRRGFVETQRKRKRRRRPGESTTPLRDGRPMLSFLWVVSRLFAGFSGTFTKTFCLCVLITHAEFPLHLSGYVSACFGVGPLVP